MNDGSAFELIEVPAEPEPPPPPHRIWNDIGIDLAKRGHMEAARLCLVRALGLEPADPILLNNYGNVLRRGGHYSKAWAPLLHASELKPGLPQVLFNLAVLHLDSGMPVGGLALIDKALEKTPGDFNFLFARACALLSAGRYQEGWKAYEVRLANQKFGGRFWEGQVLPRDACLLIHAEQGLGDTIMYHRFVSEARERAGANGAHVEYHVHQPLASILGAKRAGELPAKDADFHIPVMSLPHVLGLTSVSGEPYLKPLQTMGLHLIPGATSKIGLLWRAKTTVKSMTVDERLHGHQKSMPLSLMLELARIKGAALYSLQHGGKADIDELEAGHLIYDLGPQIGDFSDLASFCKQMDVVVTVDTGPAHLAGALGVPTVVCLHNSSAWHWGTEERSQWYDSVRLARPVQSGKWDIDQIVAMVEKCLASKS